MKTTFLKKSPTQMGKGHPLLAVWVVASCGWMLAGDLTAQSFTTLHSLSCFGNDNDGGLPGTVVLSGNTLYGTTFNSCSQGNGGGTVFAVNTDGTGFRTLYSFTDVSCFPCINSDGAKPWGGLLLSGNSLYGTTTGGGDAGNGTVFALSTDGTGFRNLHSFSAFDGYNADFEGTNSDGARPYAGLNLLGNTLYGTTVWGGGSGHGTVFAVGTDGTGFAALHSFSALNDGTNSDGARPSGGLVLSGLTLYGVAPYGGSSRQGTVFAIKTDGTGFTTLHTFAPDCSEGCGPSGRLILSGSTLYGTTSSGGSGGSGTIFVLNTDGTGFITLRNFSATSSNTNGDGAGPGLAMLSGNNLYGIACCGGSWGRGTVFQLNTNGTGFTTLHSFTATSGALGTNSDGAGPLGLILSESVLYGTAGQGGVWGDGTVFSISLPVSPPQLAITRSAANMIVTWPTNAIGFALQSATNLVSPVVWSTVSPAPVIVNGQNTVTNPISGTREFYRLSQ